MVNDPKKYAKVAAFEAEDSAFSVEFPKSPKLQLILRGADLHQTPENHERLKLEFQGVPVDLSLSIAAGDPVIFKYRQGIETATFNGYVHTVSQRGNALGNSTYVTCLGATYNLKNTGQKIYKNVTADEVVSKIATKYGLKAITQKHPRKRKSVVQAGLSDWQLITSLAKQTGFALYPSNTSIIFMSKDKLYKSKKANAPYFTYSSADDASATPQGVKIYGSILNYTIDVSDENPESNTVIDRVITGNHQVTGKIIEETLTYTPASNFDLGAVVPGESYFE